MDDDLLCMFTGRVEERDGSYVVEVPEREIELDTIEPRESYRVALFQPASHTESVREDTPETAGSDTPVDEGEIVEVEIEDLGDQGDGIARIDSGYIVFVPDTTLGERVTVEITDARDTMAFAEVIGRQDR